MQRAVGITVLTVLLLLMQLQGYVHPLAHQVPPSTDSQQVAFHSPHALDDCLVCALLASGTQAAHDHRVSALAADRAVEVDSAHFASRPSDRPGWDQSRAPPRLS